jgi:hypothetical protein
MDVHEALYTTRMMRRVCRSESSDTNSDRNLLGRRSPGPTNVTETAPTAATRAKAKGGPDRRRAMRLRRAGG